MRKEEVIFVALAMLVIFVAGAFLGSGVQKYADRARIEVRTDTITIERWKPSYRPNFVAETPQLDRPVAVVRRPVFVNDTSVVYVADTLVRTATEWEGEDCKVWASGYDVSVDSVSVKERVREITKTIYEREPQRLFALYATASGAFRNNFTAGVGAGLEWRPRPWVHVYGEGGYMVGPSGMRGGYGKAGVRFDVLRFGHDGR